MTYILTKFTQYMILHGTVGSKAVIAEITPTTCTLTHQNSIIMNSAWLVCFQRVSHRLKTCDAVWVNGDVVHVQTIDRSKLTELRDNLTIPMFDIGMDPAPWKRWQALAKKEQWQLEDWKYFLTPVDDSDSDWKPGSESESDGSDSESESDI